MVGKKHKHRTLSSLIWGPVHEEWGIWLAIAILLSITFVFSDQLASWLEKPAFIKVLDSLGKLGLLGAIIALLNYPKAQMIRGFHPGSFGLWDNFFRVLLREIPKLGRKSLNTGKRSIQPELQKEIGMENFLALF